MSRNLSSIDDGMDGLWIVLLAVISMVKCHSPKMIVTLPIILQRSSYLLPLMTIIIAIVLDSQRLMIVLKEKKVDVPLDRFLFRHPRTRDLSDKRLLGRRSGV
jgi:mannitol-specific phosphotransferase system IIBC component